jgi:hypothetical protein
MKNDIKKPISDSLMNEYRRKIAFANQQEKIANAAIKAGKANQVKVLDLKGTTTPTASERLKIAGKAKDEAKKDSIASVKLRIKKSK